RFGAPTNRAAIRTRRWPARTRPARSRRASELHLTADRHAIRALRRRHAGVVAAEWIAHVIVLDDRAPAVPSRGRHDRQPREPLVDVHGRDAVALVRVAIRVVVVVADAGERVGAKLLHDAERPAELADVARARDRIAVDEAAVEVLRDRRLELRHARA